MELAERLQDDPLGTAVDYYAQCFANHGKAIDFVMVELLCSARAAKELRIGFADRSLGTKLPSNRIKAGQELRQRLSDAGLYRDNGREHFRGFITFPLTDAQGHVTGIYGIRLDRKSEGDKELRIGRGIFNAAALAGGKPPIVAKSVAEALKLYSAGHTEVVALEGVELAAPEAPPAPEPTVPPPADDELTVEEDQITFVRDDRRYRVRGLERNMSSCQLKVSIMASRDDLVHLDTLDLVKARARVSFIKATASELYVDEELVKKDIGRLLMQLETLRSERIDEAKRPKQVELSEPETEDAMRLLRDPHLLERIVADLDACGMVGEATNKLVGYLAAVSRLLDEPLAIVIQSSSSAGKTSLMDAILAMMPEEAQLRFSGMTGQSLFYLESDAIRHKTLAISEEEGASEATYALKLLQSEGELRHATVGKTSDGRMGTQEYHVQGPTQIFLTTTAMQIDEELVNRCLVLTVDETREQTQAIHQQQRIARTREGKQAARTAARLRTLHQNAQRLLRRIAVYNPYAIQLTFAGDKTRLRRDHGKYLTLIETIALLHQHQRPIYTDEETEYINVEPSDVAIANGLAGEVLGRSLDELSPQTRNFLMLMHEFVSERSDAVDFRFTRRDLREAISWSDFQVRVHLRKLVDLEYVLVHRGKRGRQFVYELLYDGQGREGQPFLVGLIDPAKLESAPMTRSSSMEMASSSPM